MALHTSIKSGASTGARLAALLLWGVLTAGCEDQPPLAEGSEDTATATTTSAAERSAPIVGLGDEAAWRACAKRHASIMNQAPLSGAPEVQAHRADLVGRVRGATVLWKRVPRLGDLPDDIGAAVKRFEQSREPLDAIRAILADHRRDPETLRRALLREGYLFVPGVETALALVQQLSLTHLFDEPEIQLLRDGTVHQLRRAKHQRKTRYLHDDGPLEGQPAEILFADRVGLVAAELTRDTLAIDFSEAQEAFGFERIRKEHLTSDWLAAEIRYGSDLWLPVVFDVRGPSARVQCHALSAANADQGKAAYAAALRRNRVQARIREVVHAQVREQVPFDVARGGTGDAQDRFPLRARWTEAYDEGRQSFRLKGKRYPVYDDLGQPLRPQVCIEFLYDTWERASGTWVQPATRAEPKGPLQPHPKRLTSGVSIEALGIVNRRRVSKFLQYAKQHPGIFEVWTAPPDERVAFAKHERFFAHLAKHADQFRRGDMLVVSRFKQTNRARNHTMIVMETDPFVGIPTLVAGNAAKPRIQTLDGVMQISPRRYLELRIRPQASWLDDAVLRSLEAP
ncbi:MAG: hypothetical protein DRI90_22090 [Deltaproteobacteria bacterium]|nr:MAG: hypothetical protein DRI90_22090 [Deltaproteobacteria bacterium]